MKSLKVRKIFFVAFMVMWNSALVVSSYGGYLMYVNAELIVFTMYIFGQLALLIYGILLALMALGVLGVDYLVWKRGLEYYVKLNGEK